jgi:hypothetical protein
MPELFQRKRGLTEANGWDAKDGLVALWVIR